MLQALLDAYPRLLTQEQLAESADLLSGNSARQHVLRLRWKLHDVSFVENITKRGYRLNPGYM